MITLLNFNTLIQLRGINMDCEFENRCLNNSKCFRCFGESLLKLPEDKFKAKHKKNKVYDKRKADAENSWEGLEDDMVAELNKVPTMAEARRSRASGATWFEKGDVLHSILNLECKERTGNELQGGDKSISIKKSWLDKAEEEAIGEDRIMALPFRFKSDDKNYIIMEAHNIIELVNMLRAYQQDNDMKAKEISLLKERLK